VIDVTALRREYDVYAMFFAKGQVLLKRTRIMSKVIGLIKLSRIYKKAENNDALSAGDLSSPMD